MGEVTSLEDYRPHNSGAAKCLHCQHEWVAAVPAARRNSLDCPSCGLCRGEFIGNFGPDDDQSIYECGCGCQLWFVIKGGIFCRGCGKVTPLSELE